jgi:hypothetical protein
MTNFLLILAFAPVFTVAEPIPLIIDTDANNELDDQQAIAYAALSREHFDLIGLTVNRTRNGGPLQSHVEEAVRVLVMCERYPEISVFPGADGTYEDIGPDLSNLVHDGRAAVDFIIQEARKPRDQKLVLAPIGKLTNIALALAKAPDIIDRVKVVWLGSNYPDSGEYNLVNDASSVNPVTDSGVELVWAVVRYGKPSGTDAVRMTLPEVRDRLAGQGPRLQQPVAGRHGGAFATFGDYAVSLFEHIDLVGNPPSRALFDMAAIAVIKTPDWAQARTVPAPRLSEGGWVEGPNPERTIVLWENYDRDAIIDDFVTVLGTSGGASGPDDR